MGGRGAGVKLGQTVSQRKEELNNFAEEQAKLYQSTGDYSHVEAIRDRAVELNLEFRERSIDFVVNGKVYPYASDMRYRILKLVQRKIKNTHEYKQERFDYGGGYTIKDVKQIIRGYKRDEEFDFFTSKAGNIAYFIEPENRRRR